MQENKIINDFLSTSFARFTSTFHTLLQILFSIGKIIDESSVIKLNKYSNYLFQNFGTIHSGYHCYTPCLADEDVWVELICDCHAQRGPFLMAKQCEWTWKNDKRCPPVYTEVFL